MIGRLRKIRCVWGGRTRKDNHHRDIPLFLSGVGGFSSVPYLYSMVSIFRVREASQEGLSVWPITRYLITSVRARV